MTITDKFLILSFITSLFVVTLNYILINISNINFLHNPKLYSLNKIMYCLNCQSLLIGFVVGITKYNECMCYLYEFPFVVMGMSIIIGQNLPDIVKINVMKDNKTK